MDAKRFGARATTAAVLALLAGCATLEGGVEPAQRVEMRVDPAEWVLARHSGDALASMDEYVPPGESVERWTRFLSVQTFSQARVPFPGARWAMTQCRAMLVSRCPTATWTVLRDSDTDALYEWKVAGCQDEPDQHEVGRVVNGRGTWSRITFTVKGTMDPATRGEWLRRLSEARMMAATP